MTQFLSDKLHHLENHLSQHRHEGVTMDSLNTCHLVEQLRQMRDEARSMENEISRYRWNEASRKEGLGKAQQMAHAVSERSSNVIRLPIVAKPVEGVTI